MPAHGEDHALPQLAAQVPHIHVHHPALHLRLGRVEGEAFEQLEPSGREGDRSDLSLGASAHAPGSRPAAGQRCRAAPPSRGPGPRGARATRGNRRAGSGGRPRRCPMPSAGNSHRSVWSGRGSGWRPPPPAVAGRPRSPRPVLPPGITFRMRASNSPAAAEVWPSPADVTSCTPCPGSCKPAATGARSRWSSSGSSRRMAAV